MILLEKWLMISTIEIFSFLQMWFSSEFKKKIYMIFQTSAVANWVSKREKFMPFANISFILSFVHVLTNDLLYFLDNTALL